MMKKLMAALAATALMATASWAADKVKVGFVYVGPISDHGWTYQHDQGRLAIEAAFGDKVETTYLESVAEGADAERVISQLAQQGNDIIFTTSFGYMEPTIRVAKRFPDVKFEHATGYKRADNVATYSSRFYEGRYVQGQIAGAMSKTGTIGYVASFPIPEVIRGINAFMLGMQTVNPDAKVKIIWVNTWYDPGKESDAAKVLFDQGADIITQHTDSPAALQIAEERKLNGFGQASDMIKFAPNAQYTAIIDDWNSYYVSRVKALMDGKWTSEDTWGGMDVEMVIMAPYTNLPEDVAKKAAATEAALKAGDIHAFDGPIYNQAGELVVKEGETLDDGTLLGMNWYVKGVDGSVPQ